MFEERIGSIFGASAAGYTAPFSFKRLAKKAAHEMENETYVINGVDTAPALYTILVSADDDMAMRPLYAQLTRETSQFLQAEAERKNYIFVGEPLVRFMVDPGLRGGKFQVFAENIDAQMLARLRAEEEAFLSGRPIKAASSQRVPTPRNDAAAPAQPAYEQEDDMDAGLSRIPASVDDELYTPAVVEVPRTELRPTPLVNMRETVDPLSVPDELSMDEMMPVAQKEEVATCLLIDRHSGRTYTATAPRCVIGRERTNHGIVLHDPNVSRRHAELNFDGRDWRVMDLNSTNGTLVNDVDIDECLLRDGDLITVGLVNLEFREN